MCVCVFRVTFELNLTPAVSALLSFSSLSPSIPVFVVRSVFSYAGCAITFSRSHIFLNCTINDLAIKFIIILSINFHTDNNIKLQKNDRRPTTDALNANCTVVQKDRETCEQRLRLFERCVYITYVRRCCIACHKRI